MDIRDIPTLKGILKGIYYRSFEGKPFHELEIDDGEQVARCFADRELGRYIEAEYKVGELICVKGQYKSGGSFSINIVVKKKDAFLKSEPVPPTEREEKLLKEIAAFDKAGMCPVYRKDNGICSVEHLPKSDCMIVKYYTIGGHQLPVWRRKIDVLCEYYGADLLKKVREAILPESGSISQLFDPRNKDRIAKYRAKIEELFFAMQEAKEKSQTTVVQIEETEIW